MKFLTGDAFELLPTLEPHAVAITSPPYDMAMENVARALELIRARAEVLWLVLGDHLDWHGLTLTYLPQDTFLWRSDRSDNRVLVYGTRWDGEVIHEESVDLINGFAYETFPPLLLERMLACSAPGAVLDPFMGSGTVARAAQAAGRSFTGIDKDPMLVVSVEASFDAS